MREWATETGAEPVRYREEGEERYGLVPESRREESHDRLDWDEFFGAMDRDDKVVVYHGEGSDRSFEVLDRDEAVGRSALADDEVHRALMEGETVSTEVTEATVVERTVVEHADVESELVDKQHVEETYVDAELLSREVLDCTVTEPNGNRESQDYFVFETGYTTTENVDFEVEIEVEENWSVVKELVEQMSVESRVTDVEVVEDDASEASAIDQQVELEDVERTILESGLLESHDVDTAAIDRKAIESEYHEGDAVVTELLERKTIDEELRVRRLFTGGIDEVETLSVETVHREVIEGEMVEADEYEVGAEPTVQQEGGDVDRARDGPAGAGTAIVDEKTGKGEPGVERTEPAEGSRLTPNHTDKGKKVVDSSGEEIGMVSDVEDDTMYIDPHPSLTDKLRTKLDWGGRDGEDYPIEADEVLEISHDRVRLRVDR